MLKKLSIHFSKLTCVIGLGLCCSAASAAILAPGDSILFNNGTTSAINPDLDGTVVHESLIGFALTDTSGAQLLTGNYLDRVVRSTNTGQLIFSGRIQDLTYSGGNDLGLYDWSVSGFSGYQTDVDYRSDDSGDMSPDLAVRPIDGDYIIFDFDIELGSTESSLPTSIATDAMLFDLTGTAQLSFYDLTSDDLVVELDGIAAPAPVPLPAAFWLFGSGLIGLIGFQKQRRKG